MHVGPIDEGLAITVQERNAERQLMNTLEEIKNSELVAKLEAAIKRGKETCERLEEKAAAAAKATDKVVREHPYQAIGIGLGLGLLIGLLVTRSRNG